MPCVSRATMAIARPTPASSAAVLGNWKERATFRPLVGESNRHSPAHCHCRSWGSARAAPPPRNAACVVTSATGSPRYQSAGGRSRRRCKMSTPRRAPFRCAGAANIRGARPSLRGLAGFNRAGDLGELRLAELRREVTNPIEDRGGLEVVARERRVQVAARIEAIVLEEDERQPPSVLGDQLPAAATVR